MNDDEFAILIDSPGEQRNVEFKGPGQISDKHLLHRVVRAILGMTNRRDGGYVIVGVNEAKSRPDPVGLSPADLAGWTRDTLAAKAAPLVDPSVDFNLEHQTYNGFHFVLVTVREFDETPVFCRVTRHAANGSDIVLREGALYVRSRAFPATVEVRTSQELRDLLDLALHKRLRRFLELTQAAGLSLGPPGPSDAEKFATQIADLGL